jgi:hypothetical protein
MPGGDGTGPVGMGPMTGRAAGYCGGYPMPGFANRAGVPVFGGFGRRGGRGRRNWFYATGVPGWQRAGWGQPAFGVGGGYPPAAFTPAVADPRQQIDVLKHQADSLAGALDEINKRISDLEVRQQPQQPA